MEELIQILEDINPEVDFKASSDLIGEGYLTSFDLVMLVSNISQEMGIAIPANEIVPENFRSVETILTLLKKLEED